MRRTSCGTRADARERCGLLLDLADALVRGGDPPWASMPSDGERARISVTRALRSAIALLGRADAELGAHLTETVVTGTYCRCTRGVTFTGG